MIADRSRHQTQRFPQPPMTPRLTRNIAFTFLGLALVVGGVAVWLSSARATIRVTVKQDVATVSAAVDVAKTPEQGQLRGRVVQGAFDAIREFAVTASVAPVVTATTTGRVRITNKYSKEQPLIKTTRLQMSDGRIFRISASVTVPSGGSVDVGAYSDKPGETSVIPSGTTFIIPGLWIDLQHLITAESITSFTGASDSNKIVKTEEVASAYATLQDSLMEQAKGTLAAEAGVPPERLAADCSAQDDCWEAVYLVKVTDKKSNVNVGQKSDTFLAQVKANVTAVFYPKKDMQLLVRTKLKEKLPDGRDIVNLSPAKMTFTLTSADVDREIAHVAVTAEASSRLTSQSSALSKDALAGLPIEEARQKLMNIDGVESVDIVIRPSWSRSIPSQKDKIEVVIQ